MIEAFETDGPRDVHFWGHMALLFSALWCTQTWYDLYLFGAKRLRLHGRARAVVVFDRCLARAGT